MTSTGPCPLCGGGGSIAVFRDRMPLYHILEPNAAFDDSLFADLDISQCQRCLHLFNAAASADLLEKLYRETAITNIPVNPSMFARFSDVANWLGSEIIEQMDVIEIGAGGGYLARILAQRARTVTVFEPNRRVSPNMMPEKNIIFIPSTFPAPSGYSSRLDLADLVICRNVLEHVLHPLHFLNSIADALKPGGWAYIEVPDVCYTIRHGVFSDFYLQHVHYFTMRALQSAARRAGLFAKRATRIMGGHDFGVLFVKSEIYSDQYPVEPDASAPAEFLSRLFVESRSRARESVNALIGPLGLYGANLISQSFLCAVSDLRKFDVVFDDNPMNAGKKFVDKSGFVPIMAFSQDSLKLVKSIVIGAFLHDQTIGARVSDSGFNGDILTTRPHAPSQHTPRMTFIFP